jgi:hypothetical protein
VSSALPAADEAMAKGELPEQQASAIAAAASADPSQEPRLVELAKRRDLRKLREECARVLARAEDDAQRAERLYHQRSLRTWTGADGSWNLIAKHTPRREPRWKRRWPPCAKPSSSRLGGRQPRVG